LKQHSQIQWVKLGLAIAGFLILSFALAYLLQIYIVKLNLASYTFEPLVYLIVFGITAIVNVSVLPLPIAVSIMIAAALQWNPVLVALFGSIGASIGECSHYYLGVAGKTMAIPDRVMGYKLIQRWIARYGFWALAFLSFQPILPFEIGGFIAGAVKMPLYKFLPALWIGRFPKYLILIFAGIGLLQMIPLPH
jgi:uncharacterized membrane protein YdjX (TVP38/TMEM64 family)